MSQKSFLSSRLILLALASVLIPLLLTACGSQKNNATPTLTPGTSVSAGSWTTFANANNVNGLAIRGNEVWWATSGGVVKLDKSDGTYVKYTTIDGLVSNNVLSAALDHEGNLWFGTDEGVMRYDGSIWTTYTKEDGLAENYVCTIAVDQNGNIWCGGYVPLPPTSSAISCSAGVSRYDGKEWRIFNETDGLVSNFVHVITTDINGNVWFGTGIGASRYDGKSWQTFNRKNGLAGDGMYEGIYDIATDQKGNVWLVTYEGIYRYDGQNLSIYVSKSEPAPEGQAIVVVGGRRCSAMAVDRKGNLWLGDKMDIHFWLSGGSSLEDHYNYHGVSRYDGETWHYYTTTDGLASNNVRAIKEDEDGNLWFATDKGVNCYDGENWHTYGTTDEPAWDTQINSIAEDHKGNIWFGSWGGGVLCYNGTEWRHYTAEDGLADNLVSAITVGHDGTVWFGTRTGISWYDGKTWHTFNTYYGPESGYISDITVDQSGNVLAVTANKIMLYDGTTWKQLKIADDLDNGRVSSIVIDHKGNFWLSAGGHVYRYDINRREIRYTSDFLQSISEIAVDSKNNLWVGTVRGVKRYDGQSWQDVAVAYGETDVSVGALFIDKNNVKWLTIEGKGISRFDGKAWQFFTTRDGLANNSITAIAQDKEGNLWFGTASGISRYSP